MALRLLLADPDAGWISNARKHFESMMYEVDEAQNGKEAQLALYNNDYFAVILSQNIQNHSASQVIRFIKSNHPSMKVIMILNMQAKESQIKEFKELGLTEYIKKPFSFEDLSQLLESQQNIQQIMDNMPKKEGQEEEVEVSMEDAKFTKIKIDELYSAQRVLFDVFIKLGDSHYVKILHKGDAFSQERIDKYKKNKGIEHLYFMTSDRKKYVQFTTHLISKTAKSKKVSGKTKISLLKNASEKFLEEVCDEGIKPQVIDQGKEICQNITEIVEEQHDLYNLLRGFDDFDPNAVSHSFAVTLFASSIVKQFNWQSEKTIGTIAMGCMFHDIGKTKLKAEIALMRPSDMNESQLVEYKKHPEYGVEMLEGKYGISTTIKQIILQHHETFNGTGFPSGLKGGRIFTLSNIICLANDFVHIIADNKFKPTDGLKLILTNQDMILRYHSQILENFIKIFVAPDKLAKAKKTELPSNSKLFKKSG